MDYNYPTYNRSSRSRSVILQITALMTVVALFIFALNFFKIIDLSQLNKKQALNPKAGPVSKEIRNSLPFLSCPLNSCPQAGIIKDASSSAYFLFFDNLGSGSAILAATNGKFTKINSNVFTIENKERGILVKYEITSKSVKFNPNLTTVADKQPIATLGSGDNSLKFSAVATITKQYLNLKIGAAGQYLTNQE